MAYSQELLIIALQFLRYRRKKVENDDSTGCFPVSRFLGSHGHLHSSSSPEKHKNNKISTRKKVAKMTIRTGCFSVSRFFGAEPHPSTSRK